MRVGRESASVNETGRRRAVCARSNWRRNGCDLFYMTDSLNAASALAFGFVLGLKHAVEVDHLAAVYTIVSERKSLRGSLLVGMVHGLAGSAALMLLVLSAVSEPFVGLLYIAVFGLGSIGGMMLMSALVSLPLYLTAGRFTRAHLALRGLAGLFSLCFGLLTVYEKGFAGGLLG
jgi:hypothetical protein